MSLMIDFEPCDRLCLEDLEDLKDEPCDCDERVPSLGKKVGSTGVPRPSRNALPLGQPQDPRHRPTVGS